MTISTTPQEPVEQLDQAATQQPPAEEEDFLAGVTACDLSGDGTCEACQ